MLAILKRAVHLNAKHKPTRSARIKWSDAVQYHAIDCCDTDQDKTSQRNMNGQSSAQGSKQRKRFRDECEAIKYNRLQTLKEIANRYDSILPALQHFNYDKLSLPEIESTQFQLMDELDQLRRVDPEMTDSLISERYAILESKLELLLDASNYVSQLEFVETIVSSAKCDYDKKQAACFAFFFQSIRL